MRRACNEPAGLPRRTATRLSSPKSGINPAARNTFCCRFRFESGISKKRHSVTNELEERESNGEDDCL
jgi:hypothetical protein